MPTARPLDVVAMTFARPVLALAVAGCLGGCPGEATGQKGADSPAPDSAGGDSPDSGGDTADSADTAGDTATPLPDADGDGSPDDEDCDDADPAIYPGAPDTCHDGADTDCDGADDACDWDSGTHVLSQVAALLPFEPYADYQLGNFCGGSDIDGDGVGDIVIGAYAGYPSEGRVYVVRGGLPFPDSGSEGAWASVRSDDAWSLGNYGFCAGDLDGDGRDDLMVEDQGDAQMVLLTGLAAGENDRDSVAAVRFEKVGPFEDFVSGGSADLTGDGYDDVALAAGPPGAGSYGVALFAGPLAGVVGPSDRYARVRTPGGSDAWYADAIDLNGDYNGDGVLDLAVGSSDGMVVGEERGVAWILLGPFAGDRATDEADSTLEGPGELAYFGRDVAAGDIDGDGYDDLAIGSAGSRDAEPGEHLGAYLFRGGESLATSVDDAVATVFGLEGEYVGYWVASGRDLDGNGRDEVVTAGLYVDLDGDGGEECGIVIADNPTGTVHFSEAGGLLSDTRWVGDCHGAALVDDVSGDGVPDLLTSVGDYGELSTSYPAAVAVALGGV